jgi:hypothetical protein
MALKSNRKVALSAEDKQNGQYNGSTNWIHQKTH